MMPPVSRDNLLASLRQLVGDRSPESGAHRLAFTASWIRRQFESLGYHTRLQPVPFAGGTWPNIIAEPPAPDPTTPRLIIGAHYDTVPDSPGADDNASGVAALLELARLARAFPPAPAVPLRLELIAFTLEEQGLLGSAHYVRHLRSRAAPVAGMLSLEMLGYQSDQPGSQRLPAGLEDLYPRTANFIGVVGNERARALLESCAAAMRTVQSLPVETLVIAGNGEVLPPTRNSDHAPFWDDGHPAVMITDTSWFRNPHYHQPTDTIETLDLDFLTRVTQAIAAFIRQQFSPP
jgi:aminopeptidase YwaD